MTQVTIKQVKGLKERIEGIEKRVKALEGKLKIRKIHKKRLY